MDSVLYYRNISKDSKLSLEVRLQFALKASNFAAELKIDSTTVLNNRNLSFLYLMNGDYEPFKKVNHVNLKLATKLQDTLVLAIANNNLGYYFHHKQQHDSAYFYYNKALKIYEELKNIFSQATILQNISIIQLTEKDYVGSEESAIQALNLTQKLPLSETVLDGQWVLYNRLGIISLELKHLDKSLEYYDKAIEITKKMKFGNSNKYASIHNKASVYRRKGDFKKALELYQDVLNQDYLFEEDPSFYPQILENIAITKFESNDTDVKAIEQMFIRAYNISDSLGNKIIKLAVIKDLSKFYKGINNKDSALHYAEMTYNLAKEISDNDILLESMLILSDLKDGEEGKKYLNEHIKLSDSLLFNERSARNKFARIAFETDEIEKRNERITRERMWLLALSGGLILTLVLLYIIVTQRSKNKELKFKQEQQLANEEIYNLMLSQQDKVDEARSNEKKRISQELHDGILGRLFGTRLSLDSLNFSESKDAIVKRSNYISDLKIIEEDIRKISHDLNTDFISGSGFIDIIAKLIEKQTEAYQLQFKFKHAEHINWEDVSNKTKINIYRIIQESLQNIYKHANANIVKISFKPKNDVICLSISDDGKGFDIHKSKKGIGLKNIKSRVDELEGEVNFESEINKGTTLTVNVPYYSN
ncbi:tetratricopeptide repeat protein [Flavobacteriaceae bacterium LMO-SS05]